MNHDAIDLLDILKAAQWAMKHVERMEREQFLSDIKTQDSVIRRLEMIGEAARRISMSTCDQLAPLPWTRMIAMRNFLIHE